MVALTGSAGGSPARIGIVNSRVTQDRQARRLGSQELDARNLHHGIFNQPQDACLLSLSITFAF
jgi:hypothetical protein